MSKRKTEIIPDPDYPEFDGIYCGDPEHPEILHTLPYVLPDLFKYAKSQGKKVCELTKEEFEMFRFRDDDEN